MKIAAIIVNYRTPDLTACAVNATLAEFAAMFPVTSPSPALAANGSPGHGDGDGDGPDGHVRADPSSIVLVVENDSGDGSLERLQAIAARDGWGKRVEIIASPRNGGYGYGINVAVERALTRSNPPDYFYILNPDATPEPGSIEALRAFLEAHPDAGLAGGTVHGSEGEYQGSAFRYPTIWSEIGQVGPLSHLLAHKKVALPEMDHSYEADWLSGVSFMVRRAVFERAGMFDEGFFLYFEEVDFCHRARRAGFKSYYVPTSRVIHVGSASTGMSNQSARMPTYWFDSRHRYFLKHHGRGYTALADLSWMAAFLAKSAKHNLLPSSTKLRPAMFRDFLRNSVRTLLTAKAPAADDYVHERSGEPREPAQGSVDRRAAADLPIWELLAEDFATYGRDLRQPGLWAVAVHRLGSRLGSVPSRPLRAACEQAYTLMLTTVDWTWGIRLAPTLDLGRRVRIWHNGCIFLTARSIGDDVQLRHLTTMGPLKGRSPTTEELPVIEDRADIGSGVCIMGPVTVGHDAFVGANSLVLKNVAPRATVLGVPARMIPA